MMIHAETDRIILRELEITDVQSMFELDSDPDVQKYLGNKPIRLVAEAEARIQFVRQQYIDYGIGRWAIVDKTSNQL